jgi:hypothetical protein
MELAFMMFADHSEKLEEYIAALADSEAPHTLSTQRSVASRVGLDMSLLDTYDRNYIEENMQTRYNIHI